MTDSENDITLDLTPQAPAERQKRPEPDSTPNEIQVLEEHTSNVVFSNYEMLNRISEGSYGAVMRAKDKRTDQIIALKKLKYHAKFWRDGIPKVYFREISVMLEMDHPNILSVHNVMFGESSTTFYLIMEYVEHEVKVLLKTNKPRFSLGEKKGLIQQLIQGTAYLHKRHVVHRDLKTSNLLYSNKGLLKICDFGMARRYGDPLEVYTRECTTLWYRAPELLLDISPYDEKVDVWSVGCIMAEMLIGEPLFKGTTIIEQLKLIFELVGTPTKESWPAFFELRSVKERTSYKHHQPTWRKVFPDSCGRGESSLSPSGLDLLQRLLDYNPKTRISMEDALKHDFFIRERPIPQVAALMPIVPETNAMLRKHVKSSPQFGQVDRASYLEQLEKAMQPIRRGYR